MRSMTLFFMCMMLALASCKKEEIAADNPAATLSNNRFYGVKTPDNEIVASGVAQVNRLWHPCATVYVKFLNGTSEYQQKVMAYAKEWEIYSSIRFKFVTEEKADVRIGFDWNDNRNITWSYTGNSCLAVTDQAAATVSFASWSTASEKEKKGDVLRAFGQVLGLELEYRHLTFNPGWTNKIAGYWEGKITDVTWKELKEYVFDPLQVDRVYETDNYDASSIMVWPFAKEYATNTAQEYNYELSAGDISFIKRLYPRDQCEDTAIITLKTSSQNIEHMGLSLAKGYEVTIDWGDGTRETHTTGGALQHNYATDASHIIKFYGDKSAITAFECFKQQLSFLDVSKNEQLEILRCHSNQLTSLDVSNNTMLKSLSCHINQLVKLDVSNNLLLTALDCYSNKITAIDVRRNTELVMLKTYSNPITELDVSNNLQLEGLYCFESRLTSLNVSKNTQLEALWCYSNTIPSLDVSKNTQLKVLKCGGNLYNTLNVSNNLLLIELNCGSPNLASIDITKNSQLKSFTCYESRLTSLDVSKNLLLTDMILHRNNITSIDVSKNLWLTSFACSANQLTSLNVSNNKQLKVLNCHYNQLTSIDVSNNLQLERLYVHGNPITTLNLTNNKLLSALSCFTTPLVKDQVAMANMARSLTNRKGQEPGVIDLQNTVVPSGIVEICTASNWIIQQ